MINGLVPTYEKEHARFRKKKKENKRNKKRKKKRIIPHRGQKSVGWDERVA